MTALLLLLPAPAARACGGGVVTTAAAGMIGANAQRIIISVHGGTTDVVTQVGVPAATADYGVLIPVTGQPTIDPIPVASADIDRLFGDTAPSIMTQTGGGGGDDGSGCGCPLVLGSKGGAPGRAPPRGGVQVSEPVAIGPATAVTLTADTGDAINAWLAENGFMIPTADQAIVDAYAGPGRYFIAIRRSAAAGESSASSVGIHFTLAGDQRALPLRFAHLGAGPTVGFTVLVAADDVVAPSAPFAALTLSDLDTVLLRATGYAPAVTSAVAQHGNHAFLIEGTWPGASLLGSRWPSLLPIIRADQTVTRLSTMLPATALDSDAVFDQAFNGTVLHQIYVERTNTPSGRSRFAAAFALLAFAAVVRRRPRR